MTSPFTCLWRATGACLASARADGTRARDAPRHYYPLLRLVAATRSGRRHALERTHGSADVATSVTEVHLAGCLLRTAVRRRALRVTPMSHKSTGRFSSLCRFVAIVLQEAVQHTAGTGIGRFSSRASGNGNNSRYILLPRHGVCHSPSPVECDDSRRTRNLARGEREIWATATEEQE